MDTDRQQRTGIRRSARSRGIAGMRGRGLVLGLLVGLFGLWHTSYAADVLCAAGDVACLIREITTANGNGEVNTITLEAGTYTLTAVENMADGPNGLPSVTSTLTIRGRGADTTTIERGMGAPAFRLGHVAVTGALTLEGLTLQGGSLEFTLGRGFFGAGLFNRGTVVLINTIVTLNKTNGPNNGGGGGIWNEGTLIATDTTISKNSAISGVSTFGAGIANSGGLLLLTNTAIDDNGPVEHDGGGIGNMNHGTAVLTNSTVSHNHSQGNGAGLSNSTGTMILTNTTVADNNSGGNFTNSGGLFNGGTAVLTNTIIARNTTDPIPPGNPPDCAGAVTSLGHNLIGDPTGCTIVLLSTDLTGDPGLGDFTDNGTPGNGHFPLLPTSQAINAGNNTACPLTDQLEQPRVGVCDIGAVEFQGKGPHRKR